jgi:hypothetical protein
MHQVKWRREQMETSRDSLILCSGRGGRKDGMCDSKSRRERETWSDQVKALSSTSEIILDKSSVVSLNDRAVLKRGRLRAAVLGSFVKLRLVPPHVLVLSLQARARSKMSKVADEEAEV